MDLPEMVRFSLNLLGSKLTQDQATAESQILDFFKARFVNFHASRDFSLDVVEAAVRSGFVDVVDTRSRVEALNVWKQRKDFDAIMVGFKRVVNILKDGEFGNVNAAILTEDAEKELYQTFQTIKDSCAVAIESGDYQKALELLADLRLPIDGFFDNVMVMAEDQAIRQNRLALLGQIAAIFKNIADFSFIGSTAG